MNKFILDTSVIIKWINQKNEKNVKQALKIYDDLINEKIIIILPDFALIEITNGLQIGKEISSDDTTKALHAIYLLPLIIKELTESIIVNTSHLAQQYDITIYDALFVSLAQMENCQLISDDIKAHGKIHDGTVLMLSNYKR